MHIGTFESFTECYLELIKATMSDYEHESAPRNQKIREIIGATFTITNPRHRVPSVAGRKFGLTYLAAELAWYLSGNNETAWISKYSSFWKNISDDGVTANSAYGARLFKPHDTIAQGRFVQWDYVINELRNDPDSRRAVMHLRTPNDSVDAKLDVPCTLALQFFIRDNKLHQVVHMRSSDVIFGIAYDVPAFTLFQEILANELDVELGTYTHVSNSLHIYERHFEMAENILKTENIKKSIEASRAAGPQEPLAESSLASIPIEEIMWFEEGLPLYDTVTDVVDAYHALELWGYWSDLAAILAAKRIRELGDKKFARDFINAALHQSYSFYKRGEAK